jgi:hypothetical protein
VVGWAATLLARLGGCAPSSWSALGERKRGESGSLFELFAIHDLRFLGVACNQILLHDS